MDVNFARWPFAPPSARLPEEEERWWETCYVPPPALEVVESHSQWCVLWGGFQQGKSALLRALKRRQETYALVLEDDSFSAPGLEHPSGNILYRILYRASWALRERLRNEPGLFASLSKTQLEFLRWAVEKFHGRRAFLRWLDGLPAENAQTLETIPYEDLYPTQTETIHVEGQLEELVNVCHRLGYQQVILHVDTTPFLSAGQQDEIRATLGWLKPMEHYGIKVILALPPLFSKEEIVYLGRGRLRLVEVEAAPNLTSEIIARHLRAATAGQFENLRQLCSPDLLARLEKMVAEEFDRSSPPGAWLKVCEIALEMVNRTGQVPLSSEMFPALRHTYALRHQPLRLGAKEQFPGVWRGYQWLSLDRALYDFLTLLMQQKGRRVDSEMMPSKGNLHTLASRLRKVIEPDPADKVYLKNRRDEGYWLENFVPLQEPRF